MSARLTSAAPNLTASSQNLADLFAKGGADDEEMSRDLIDAASSSKSKFIAFTPVPKFLHIKAAEFNEKMAKERQGRIVKKSEDRMVASIGIPSATSVFNIGFFPFIKDDWRNFGSVPDPKKGGR